eukprot:CAMPEP_0203749760 /NCGR_PEP_ID=MMETSP0098-20131031/4189_1 /ASSEMBLY_ACC=CAM_ASM_000208 /TAXON_ID=96639 /ORGANISM=" , Strain NY0313808BC1" /LENGTH=95 /DNA_ID=CAMNT_0050638855 /DNA_START=154 /DNA_END=438 /DNA_ORIENTATION=-
MAAPKRSGLEVFKFSLYLVLPVISIAYFNKPENMKWLIETKKYIVFPAEGPATAKGSKDNITEALEEMRKKRLAEVNPGLAVEAEGTTPQPRKKW